jgi:hypothetical protein
MGGYSRFIQKLDIAKALFHGNSTTDPGIVVNDLAVELAIPSFSLVPVIVKNN